MATEQSIDHTKVRIPNSRIERDKKVLSAKLVSLYQLLERLGWLVASEDPFLPDTFVLQMHTFERFRKPHISRIELDYHLLDVEARNILCRTRNLVVWREPDPKPQPQSSHPSLTNREREVNELLLTGMTLSAIATDLGISQRTVEKHVENLYRKRGVNSYNELIFGKRSDSKATP